MVFRVVRSFIREANDMSSDLTLLLREWSSGSGKAGEVIFAQLYPELKRVAANRLAEHRGNISVSVTELVHETFLKLIDQCRVQWQDRLHFLAVSAQLMRRILVDYHRSKRRLKRGGQWKKTELSDMAASEPIDVLLLHEALEDLEKIDPSATHLVVLRYFGGLTIDDCAELMQLGRATVFRRWQFARLWLKREMTQRLRNRPGRHTAAPWLSSPR